MHSSVQSDVFDGLPDEIIETVKSSAIFNNGGFLSTRELIVPKMVNRLREEAFAQMQHASLNESTSDDQEAWRGGAPRRKMLTAPGGPFLKWIYGSEQLLFQLRQLTGLNLVPTASEASFSYYCRKGDGIALHRDISKCDLTVILPLYHHVQDGKPGPSKLCAYPERYTEPLTSIRSSPTSGVRRVSAKPGEAIVILGGIVPHLVLPVKAHEVRITALMCFEAIA